VGLIKKIGRSFVEVLVRRRGAGHRVRQEPNNKGREGNGCRIVAVGGAKRAFTTKLWGNLKEKKR